MDIIITILKGVGPFVSGIAIKIGIDQYNNIRKHKYLKNFFGDSIVKNKIILSMPIFHPLNFDDFDENNNTMVKKIFNHSYYEAELNKTEKKVPIYSKMIVLEDYVGYKNINDIFLKYRNLSLDFIEDSKLIDDWAITSSIISIGGPRSNGKTEEIFNLDSIKKFIKINHGLNTLESWTLEVLQPINVILKVEKEKAIGVIIRTNNPNNKNGSLSCFFGCRSESTLITTKLFNKNFKDISGISKKYKNQTLLYLYAIHGKKFCIQKPMLISSADKIIFIDRDLIKKYEITKSE